MLLQPTDCLPVHMLRVTVFFAASTKHCDLILAKQHVQKSPAANQTKVDGVILQQLLSLNSWMLSVCST